MHLEGGFMFKAIGFFFTLCVIYIMLGIPYIYTTFILGFVKNVTFYTPLLFVGWIAWRAYNSRWFRRRS